MFILHGGGEGSILLSKEEEEKNTKTFFSENFFLLLNKKQHLNSACNFFQLFFDIFCVGFNVLVTTVYVIKIKSNLEKGKTNFRHKIQSERK